MECVCACIWSGISIKKSSLFRSNKLLRCHFLAIFRTTLLIYVIHHLIFIFFLLPIIHINTRVKFYFLFTSSFLSIVFILNNKIMTSRRFFFYHFLLIPFPVSASFALNICFVVFFFFVVVAHSFGYFCTFVREMYLAKAIVIGEKYQMNENDVEHFSFRM